MTSPTDHKARAGIAAILDQCTRDVSADPRWISYEHRPSGAEVSRCYLRGAWRPVQIELPECVTVAGALDLRAALHDIITLAQWLERLDDKTLDRMVAVDGLQRDGRRA